MRRLWFVRFFEEGEGSGGGGSAPEKRGAGQEPGGRKEPGKDPGKGAGQEPGGPKDGGDAGGEDVSGLKSALEKERQARKDLAQQMKELREIAGRSSEAEKKLEEYSAKLAEYEFRDKRDAALESAIAEATKDGKSSVDRAKAARLVGKLGRAESLEADVADIVETLRVPVGDGGSNGNGAGNGKDGGGGAPAGGAGREPALKGQPSGRQPEVTTDLPYDKWPALRKADPDAYEAMLKARRQKGAFRIMGS